MNTSVRKCISLLLLCAMIISVPGTGLAEDINLSSMSLDELHALYENTLCEIYDRSVSDIAPAGTDNGEILFRGWAWGLSETEVTALLGAENIPVSTRGEGDGYTEVQTWEIDLTENFYAVEGLKSSRDAGYWIFCRTIPEDLLVAGYSISGIGASFLYDVDDEGVHREASRSQLIHAHYNFNVADPEAAYLDLTAKLSALYGDAEEYTAHSGSYSIKHALWYGGNDTGIHLDLRTSNNTNSTDYNLYLYYGKSNSMELMNAVISAVAREQLENAEGDVSGL